MKNKKKVIKWMIVIIIAAGCAAAYWYQSNQPLTVKTYAVSSRDVANTITEEGIVSPVDQYDILPKISGTVREAYVREGDAVSAGDPLFVIDVSDLESQLKQISAQVISAQAQAQAQNGAIDQAQIQYDYSLSQLEKATALYEAGIYSKNQLDEAQYACDTAAAALNSAKATQEYYNTLVSVNSSQALTIRSDIQKAEVTAPQPGIIMNMEAKAGSFVSPQSPALLIYGGEEFAVEGNLRAQDAAQLKIGDKLLLTLPLNTGDKSVEAVITKIADKAEQMQSVLGVSERRVKVTAGLPKNALPVRYGYSLDMKFTTGVAKAALPVPKTAVFPQNGGYAVWVIENAIAAVRTVETGLKTETEVVVTSGLSAGDLLILDPPSSLKEGMPVFYE